MSVRVHTTHISELNIVYCDTEAQRAQAIEALGLDEYGDEYEKPFLVIEDSGNMEALVLFGDLTDVLGLASELIGQTTNHLPRNED